MSAGDEDEDIDVEAAESDRASVEAKDQTADLPVSKSDDRPADRYNCYVILHILWQDKTRSLLKSGSQRLDCYNT